MRLAELNTLDADAAAGELLRCCGSTRWARAMAAARPFASVDQAADRSDAIWSALDPADWLEAFAAHPRIGERSTPPAGAPRWSADEQSGVADSSRARLLRLNGEYERRFGYIFIICATGKTGDEMLAALERRMRNNPDDELREAADEQRTIARLRLAKLLT
jgi:OHCU decarboxylase